jgi:hypothetical protein
MMKADSGLSKLVGMPASGISTAGSDSQRKREAASSSKPAGMAEPSRGDVGKPSIQPTQTNSNQKNTNSLPRTVGSGGSHRRPIHSADPTQAGATHSRQPVPTPA